MRFQFTVFLTLQLVLGTTWLQEIVWLLKHDNTDGEEYQKNVWDRVPLIEQAHPGKESSIDVVERMHSPRIFKTHLPAWSLEEQILKTQCKAIVITRNPKDVLVSYYHMLRQIIPKIVSEWSIYFDMFCKGDVIYGNFFDYVISWFNNRDKDNFLFLKYEDMKADRSKAIQTIATFLDVSVTQERLQSIVERTSFKKMKENPYTNMETSKIFMTKEVAFIRKGQVGDWTNYLTVDQNEYMDQIIDDRLKDTGIEFEYI